MSRTVNLLSKTRDLDRDAVRAEAAQALFVALLSFLRNEGFSESGISRTFNNAKLQSQEGTRRPTVTRKLRQFLRVYQDMGALFATWYSDPRFLDGDGRPLPLKVRGNRQSIKSLAAASRVHVPCSLIVKLMLLSPVIRECSDKSLVEEGRVFMLPGFELLRASLVVGRFLDTLQRNSKPSKAGLNQIFERSSYANQINQEQMARLLRDIKERGTAFLDSVDGQMEFSRAKTSREGSQGELGVFMFAWMQAPNKRKAKQLRDQR